MRDDFAAYRPMMVDIAKRYPIGREMTQDDFWLDTAPRYPQLGVVVINGEGAVAERHWYLHWRNQVRLYKMNPTSADERMWEHDVEPFVIDNVGANNLKVRSAKYGVIRDRTFERLARLAGTRRRYVRKLTKATAAHLVGVTDQRVIDSVNRRLAYACEDLDRMLLRHDEELRIAFMEIPDDDMLRRP